MTTSAQQKTSSPTDCHGFWYTFLWLFSRWRRKEKSFDYFREDLQEGMNFFFIKSCACPVIFLTQFIRNFIGRWWLIINELRSSITASEEFIREIRDQWKIRRNRLLHFTHSKNCSIEWREWFDLVFCLIRILLPPVSISLTTSPSGFVFSSFRQMQHSRSFLCLVFARTREKEKQESITTNLGRMISVQQRSFTGTGLFGIRFGPWCLQNPWAFITVISPQSQIPPAILRNMFASCPWWFPWSKQSEHKLKENPFRYQAGI